MRRSERKRLKKTPCPRRCACTAGNNSRNSHRKLDVDSGHQKQNFLPAEIVFEILRRLPLKSAGRFKCVCKLWCSMIETHYFVEERQSLTKPVYVYRDLTEVNEGQEYFRCLAIADGLLLEKSSSTGKLRLRNPTTNQILNLPDPLDTSKHVQIFYVPTLHNYKLISTHGRKGVNNGGCEVLNLGIDLTWRPIDIPSLYYFGFELGWSHFAKIDDMFFIARFLYIGVCEIVCIEMANEQVLTLPVPQDLFSDWINVRPTPWGQKLSLTKLVKEELHVWVLEDLKKQKWAEEKIVIRLTFLKKYPEMVEKLQPRCFINGYLCFIPFNYALVSYHIEKEKEYIKNAPVGKQYVCSYNPTLVKLQ